MPGRISAGFGALLQVIVVVSAVGPAPAAVPAFTEFSIPTPNADLGGITAGPDGNLWFTEQAANKIGRITPAGVITEFPIPPTNTGPRDIAAGPDGSLWFTENLGNKIGRITLAGVITDFPIPTAASGPTRITAGPDGNLWFLEAAANQIGRITPAGVITEFPIPTPNSGLTGITSGNDGNVWFTEKLGNKIGRITPAGVITEFPLPTPNSQPSGITRGPNIPSTIWFTESGTNRIGRLGPNNSFPEYAAGGGSLDDIIAGPGRFWFPESGNRMGLISGCELHQTCGVIHEFTLPSPASRLALGPDGNVWYTVAGSGAIVRVRPPPFVTISPPSGTYLATQRFDLAIVLNTLGIPVVTAGAFLNGVDVTGALVSCGTLGTTSNGLLTFRCPGVSEMLPPGTHTLSVFVYLKESEGLSVTDLAEDAATWEILTNTEP